VSRIFIVGAGRVGTATGRALRSAGHQVSFVDTDPHRVAELLDAGLDARPLLDLRGEPDSFVVVALPVPVVPARTGSGYYLSILRDGIRAIGRALGAADARHVVVIRSAVPPNTTDGLVRHTLERISGKRAGAGFDLVCHPEFLRPGHTDHDAQWPALTVIGAQDRRVADRVARELAPFGGVRHLVGSAAAAELIKGVHDLRRSVTAVFWAEIESAAGRLGADAGQVARTLADDGTSWIARADSGPPPAQDAEAFLAAITEAGAAMPVLSAALAGSASRRRAS